MFSLTVPHTVPIIVNLLARIFQLILKMIRFDGNFMKTLVSFTSSKSKLLSTAHHTKQYSQTNLQQVGQIQSVSVWSLVLVLCGSKMQHH